MESRLKERLTGAAILVALIVLIVPEIFHGRRSVPTRSVPPALAAAAPARSYTIDLARPAPPPSAAQSPPLQPAAARPAAVQPAAAPAGPPAGSATGPAAPRSRSRSVEPQAPAAPQAQTPERVRGGGWTVQLGLFAKQANAQRLARSAQSHGFAVGVTRYGSRGLYRVAVADVANRAAAEQLSRRLRGAGLPAAILGPR